MTDHAPPSLTPLVARRVFVILNPVAGQGGVESVREVLASAFTATGSGPSNGDNDAADESRCTIRETTADDDPAALARAAAEQGSYGLVVAAGGDGTVSAVANGLVGTSTPLGILPLGTANVLARELGIPIGLEDACRVLAGSYAVTAIDAMRVKDRCYFTQVGVGIDAMMIRDTRREAKRRFGRAAYLWTAFTGLLGFAPRRFRVECDGRSLRVRASQLVVANCGLLGQPPLRWGPDIRPDDGRIDLCIARARSLRDYATLACYVVLGQHKRSPNIRYLTAQDRITIATQRALPVQADGEVIGETPVEVVVVPRTLRVVVPSDDQNVQVQ